VAIAGGNGRLQRWLDRGSPGEGSQGPACAILGSISAVSRMGNWVVNTPPGLIRSVTNFCLWASASGQQARSDRWPVGRAAHVPLHAFNLPALLQRGDLANGRLQRCQDEGSPAFAAARSGHPEGACSELHA
jgi:hypothetical protein